MQGLQAAFGLKGEDLWMMATGFGSGFGRRQLVCGAISGGVMACGLAIARERGYDRETRTKLRDESYAVAKALTDRFEAEMGATDCLTLTGFDFADPEQRQAFQKSDARETVCGRAVEVVVREAIRLLS